MTGDGAGRDPGLPIDRGDRDTSSRDRPRRRDLLAGLGGTLAGALAGVAGCLAPTASRETTGGTSVESIPLARLGTPPTICEESVSGDTGIYAVDRPRFDDDWGDREVSSRYGALTDGSVVVGVERGGSARAYPLSVLRRHEVVNDDLGGPLLVTYCPLCESGLVAERTVRGSATRFFVSGLLWLPPRLAARRRTRGGTVFGADREGSTDPEVQANLVMYDGATTSYWSQILARAICGPLRGESLRMVPSTVATWSDWRRSHPETTVLLPPPYSGTVEPG